MDDPNERDDELARLRRTVALARFYLDRFADPHSFVWKSHDKSPHDFALTAISELDAEQNQSTETIEHGVLASGTGPMNRLERNRAGFVEFHLLLARQALDIGEVGAARAALRVLRTNDFADQAQVAEALLRVLRDSSSTDDEIEDAAVRLTRLAPSPSRG